LKTTVSEPDVCKRVIEFEIPVEEYSAAFDRKVDEYRRDVRLPGFRPGKVPVNVIKQRFGDAAKAAVIEDLVKDSYKTACDEHNIVPVSEAKLTDMNEDEGKPLRFTIETEVDPPIEITGYDKLKITPKIKKLKDSDVEENFQNLLERFAEFTDVDRASKKGDYVRIEYRRVTIDGAERPDIQSPGYPFEVGAANALKEFDKGLTGVSAGEEVEITVKFPKDYSDPGAAGKTGEFSITVSSVQEKRLPEMNEEFLKKLGDFKTVEALKEEIRKGMEESEAERARKEAHAEAVDALIKANPFEVPQSKVEKFVDMMIEDYAQGQGQGGGVAESREELTERFKDAAVMALKRIRIVDFIADKEKIKATQEEVDKEIEIMAMRYGRDFDEVKQVFRKNGTTNRLRLEIREKKTLDFLIGEGK
jgi:trigger factor